MKVPPLLIHASVAAAVVLGIGGMGIVYNAVSTSNLAELSIGWPLLMIGLWWTGRYLALSMTVSKARTKAQPAAQRRRHTDRARGRST
jgi:hypothetical protein